MAAMDIRQVFLDIWQIFSLRGRQTRHLFMYVRFIIHNSESHLFFRQKRSIYRKNSLNWKLCMGKIRVTQTNISEPEPANYFVDLSIEQSVFF